MKFSTQWGFSTVEIVNLFAVRGTDPGVIKTTKDPVGPENDAHIASRARAADVVICAWGTNGRYKGRDEHVYNILKRTNPMVFALGMSKSGHPKHPLYLPRDSKPQYFKAVP